MYYKIRRVSDNLTVIPYTTGSAPKYSLISYDKKGSFFEMDMAILESNYSYEINFLYKEGNQYIEDSERFRFRIEP